MNIEDEKFNQLLSLIIERFDHVDRKLDKIGRIKDCLDGDKLMDNQDMCELLGVTKRTLARYRHKKLVTYYLIDGRAYYKSSEIKNFLTMKGKKI